MEPQTGQGSPARRPSASLPACASRQAASAAAARSRAVVQAISAAAASSRAAFAVVSDSSAAARAVARSVVTPTSALRRRTSSAAASRSAPAASETSRAAAASAAASERLSRSASHASAAARRSAAALRAVVTRLAASLTVAACSAARSSARAAATSSSRPATAAVAASAAASSSSRPTASRPTCSRRCASSRAFSASPACAAASVAPEREAVAALGEVLRALGLGLPQRLGALRREARGGVAQPFGRILERQLERRVVAGVEQRPEDLLALLGVGLQQLLEAALRQHDDLAELLGAKAEELLGLDADLRPARLQRTAALLEAVVAVAQPPERGRLVVLRDAVTLELGTLLLRLAHDPEALGAQREVEGHAGEELRVGVVAAHRRSRAPSLVLGAAAGDAVEGERHGVEDGGLAGAGGSGDEEEARAPELGEVERLLAGVGAEGLHHDAQRSHEAASRRRRSSVSMTPVSAARRASPSSPSVT